MKRLGIVLLVLVLLASMAGNGLLWSQRRQLVSERDELQGQIDDLKDQVTGAAAVQDENRRLKSERDRLKEQLESRAEPTPDETEEPTPDETEEPTPDETEEPTPGGPTPTVDPNAPPATPGPAKRLTPEQQAILDEIGQQVIALRGLPETEPVHQDLMSQEELRVYLEKDLDEEVPPEEFHSYEQLFWLLGLAPRDFEYRDFYLDLLTEQVAGFYDPDTKSFYVISNQSTFKVGDKITYAHEFDHHLQDQNFDLNKLSPKEMQDDDQAVAISSLIEGDATLLMSQWLQQHLTPQEQLQYLQEANDVESSILDSAPTYLREGLIFPYQQGMSFVQGLYEQGGWKAVDEALANPPRSTEQILHPEKYGGANADEPSEVAMPDLSAALSGWTEVYTNTLGEFDLQIMLDEGGTGRIDAQRGADGWDGMRYSLYNDEDGSPLLVISSVWDSDGEAQEFEEMLRMTLEQDGEIFQRDDVSVALKRNGSQVLLVYGAEASTVTNVARALP